MLEFIFYEIWICGLIFCCMAKAEENHAQDFRVTFTTSSLHDAKLQNRISIASIHLIFQNKQKIYLVLWFKEKRKRC